MIVYVESNFTLEVALRQEQAEAADTLLGLAEAGRIVLAVPSFALSEPYSTIAYRGAERRRLYEALEAQLRQLQRSTLHQQVVSIIQPAWVSLLSIAKREIDVIESTTRRLLASGTIITLELAIFDEALMYERRFDLTPQDAVVLASVIRHARQAGAGTTKCFLSRDTKAFLKPPVRAELASAGCRYIGSFVAGLDFVQNHIRQGGDAAPDQA